MRSLVLASVVAFAALLVGSRASAQEMGADFGAATGLEGGDSDGHTVFRRARTRLRASVDLRNEEDRRHTLWIVGFVEIEPHSAVGAEVRYGHWFSPRLGVFGGATTLLHPHLLFGATCGATYTIPIRPEISVFVEPALSALPFGSDIPEGSVLTWAHLTIGVRGDLTSIVAPPKAVARASSP